ncbi:protein disulfide-isomerase A3-like [Littorina saxatilis]|uniref:Protein disulfide-isomerase n=1 Tax=Littorina saxatilis TaxID=31220 RepID=A0AAN9B002_9CAEN
MIRALVVLSFAVLAVKANVLEFTDSNFKSEIQDHNVILVEFYAPWCGHCKNLAPEYEKAAERLLKNDHPVSLAKVDCSVETKICKEYGVSGYPTLKIFRNGEFSKDYDGPREADGIVKVMGKEGGPSSKELKTKKEFDDFVGREDGSVVGFFTDADSEQAKTFQKLADSFDDLLFAHTYSSQVMDKLKYKDEVVLFRPKVMASKFEETAVKFTGDATKLHKLKGFLTDEAFGLCAHRTLGNAGNFKKPTFVAFYEVDFVKNPKGTNYWRNRVMKVAKKLRDEGLSAFFAISDRKKHWEELQKCGQIDYNTEKPFVCAYADRSRKFNMKDPFSMESLEKFVRDVLDDAVEPFFKSGPIPNNDGPLKTAVDRNFYDLVNDPEKDVLIEFYVPWCGHCKTLAPKLEELAEMLKDEPEITIAKMDATADDAPSPYEVRGFPTLYFAPKGSKSSPKMYEGGQEVDDLIKYLAKEATNELEGYDRKGKKKGDKKKKEKTEL